MKYLFVRTPNNWRVYSSKIIIFKSSYPRSHLTIVWSEIKSAYSYRPGTKRHYTSIVNSSDESVQQIVDNWKSNFSDNGIIVVVEAKSLEELLEKCFVDLL